MLYLAVYLIMWVIIGSVFGVATNAIIKNRGGVFRKLVLVGLFLWLHCNDRGPVKTSQSLPAHIWRYRFYCPIIYLFGQVE